MKNSEDKENPPMTREVQIMPAMSVSDIKTNILTIHKVMKEVMQEKVHYGVIPGCGDKKTLLKPGAEKIMATFRIAPSYEVTDLSVGDERRYRVITTGTSASGHVLGQGVGEASTNEDKYKWQKAVNEQEFNETPENKRRSKWKKGAKGKPDYQVKQIRTDPEDKANTVLKMAKKRSVIDMTITTTACSDIFTQDIGEEDKNPPKKGYQKERPTTVSQTPPPGTNPGEPPPEQNTGELKCADCGTEIPENVFDFSKKRYGRPLCFDDQEQYKNG